MAAVLFGIFPTPSAADYPAVVEQVLAAERLGLDLVGIQDHPYQRRFVDTFALIADLQARTSRLRFFPDVANLPLRGPVMIAKAAASLDVMSGGRFELGLGAGTFWDAVAGMGGPRRTSRESIDALEEALPIVRGVLDGERVVRSPGPHYPIPGFPAGPAPAHRVEIWLGVYRRRGLELTGRLADGWLPSLAYMPPASFRAASARIDDAALAAGRDPRAIRRLYNVAGRLTAGEVGDGPLDGPAELWIDRLTEWAVDFGADGFILWPEDSSVAAIERFATEIGPAVRAAADAGRPRV